MDFLKFTQNDKPIASQEGSSRCWCHSIFRNPKNRFGCPNVERKSKPHAHRNWSDPSKTIELPKRCTPGFIHPRWCRNSFIKQQCHLKMLSFLLAQRSNRLIARWWKLNNVFYRNCWGKRSNSADIFKWVAQQPTRQSITLPETNIAPENCGFQHEFPLPGSIFRGLC